MSAGYHHFIVEQGATFGQTLTLKDSAGSVINLTGFSGAMQFRENPEASSSILDITTANSRMTMGGGAGTITLAVSATDTASLNSIRWCV